MTACFGKGVGFSAEILRCLEMLMRTDAGTGLMHESFHKDNPERYTRPWFAWQNTLFGELVLHLIDEGVRSGDRGRQRNNATSRRR